MTAARSRAAATKSKSGQDELLGAMLESRMIKQSIECSSAPGILRRLGNIERGN